MYGLLVRIGIRITNVKINNFVTQNTSTYKNPKVNVQIIIGAFWRTLAKNQIFFMLIGARL
jgi:hypothetical protein